MPLRHQGWWRGRGVIWLLVSVLGLGGVVFVARSGAATVPTVQPQPLAKALHDARARLSAPGAQAAIVVCGRKDWAGSDGVIDLQSKRPVGNDTPFVIASTTKSVTAAMIMQQVQARRLSLDTRLSRFYPNLPDAGQITVRMLMRMRSGLEEYEDIPAIQNLISEDRHPWDRNDIIDELAKTKHTTFEPGSEHQYSNTNWVVLGGILQQLTGKPIQTYFNQNIASRNRAGMTSSTWNRTAKLVADMAHGYDEQAGRAPKSLWVRDFGPATYVFGPVFTDGGLVSTATDLARFGSALLDGRPHRLVSPATVNKMIQIPANNENYGLGISVSDFDRHEWFGFSGSYGGYESEMETDRTRHVTIAVTTNMYGGNVAEPIWKKVALAYDKQAPRGPTTCR